MTATLLLWFEFVAAPMRMDSGASLGQGRGAASSCKTSNCSSGFRALVLRVPRSPLLALRPLS